MPASLRCGECGVVSEVVTDHQPHPDHAHLVGPNGEQDRVPLHILRWTCPACGKKNKVEQIRHHHSVDDHNRAARMRR
jgi:transposase